MSMIGRHEVRTAPKGLAQGRGARRPMDSDDMKGGKAEQQTLQENGLGMFFTVNTIT